MPEADIGNSFDHLVGAGEYCRRNCEAQCFRGLKVDYQLVFGRRLHWQVGWLLTLEDAIDVFRGASELIDRYRAVGNQAAVDDVVTKAVVLRAACTEPQA